MNLTDTQLTILVVIVLVVLFFLGDCKLTCNSKESYSSRRYTAPTVAYPDKGGNMLQGWVRDNAKIVGDDDCERCMSSALNMGADFENASYTCVGYGSCDPMEVGH